jgi:hypothetical protein
MGDKPLFFGVPQVDEPRGPRWANALQWLREGRSIVYRGVGLLLPKPNLILVEVPAGWLDISQMPTALAEERLDLGEAIINELRETADDFATLTQGRRVEIRLVDEWADICAIRGSGATTFTDLWRRHHQEGS